MKNKKEILTLEILYDYVDELDELRECDEFKQLLLDEAISTIENALEKDRKTTRMFYVPNIRCSIILEKSNFNKVLDTAIGFYEFRENYKKCAKLIKLKEKVNGTKERNKKLN
mgnify:FL=1|tara:strand:- start:4091 stop:4429 length:339 start_codon:yes stop_codon:yes gene_type:complete